MGEQNKEYLMLVRPKPECNEGEGGSYRGVIYLVERVKYPVKFNVPTTLIYEANFMLWARQDLNPKLLPTNNCGHIPT
ncbi:MAG: hypothetical protein Q8M00_03190 [bacterium]|nr:hypothetical protein [bacterium]